MNATTTAPRIYVACLPATTLAHCMDAGSMQHRTPMTCTHYRTGPTTMSQLEGTSGASSCASITTGCFAAWCLDRRGFRSARRSLREIDR